MWNLTNSSVFYSLTRFCAPLVCGNGFSVVFLWLWDRDTGFHVLTHHSGVCRPGQRAPLEPSTSPGDDPEDTHRRAVRQHLHTTNTWISSFLAREACLNLITAGRSHYSSTGWYVKAGWGNKERGWLVRRRISQRNIYIVKAIELINRITDKGGFIFMLPLKHWLGKKQTRRPWSISARWKNGSNNLIRHWMSNSSESVKAVQTNKQWASYDQKNKINQKLRCRIVFITGRVCCAA